MEIDQKNIKDMSLADIIKNDKAQGKLGDKFGKKRGRGGRKFSGDKAPK